MQINSNLDIQNSYFSHKVRKTITREYHALSSAVTKSEEEQGEFLGLTMLPEEGKLQVYGMRAMLSDKSTPNKPIVQIVSNLDGKKEVFDIDISNVDPENASRMEMFALCSYADKYGSGTGSTFGSFQTFKIYEETAKQNGYINQVDESVSAWDQFRNEKVDWIKINEDVLNILKSFKDPKIMDLFCKGQKLSNLYSKYHNK